MKWKKIQEDLNRYADACRDKYRELMPLGPGGVIIQVPVQAVNTTIDGAAEGKDGEVNGAEGELAAPIEPAALKLPDVKKGESIMLVLALGGGRRTGAVKVGSL